MTYKVPNFETIGCAWAHLALPTHACDLCPESSLSYTESRNISNYFAFEIMLQKYKFTLTTSASFLDTLT